MQTYPDEVLLYNPLSGNWIKDNPWPIDLVIEPDQKETILYYVQAPDMEEAYNFETEVRYKNHDVYSLYQQLSTDMVVDKDSTTLLGDILAALEAHEPKGKDKLKIHKAVRYIEAVQEMNQRLQKRISVISLKLLIA